MRGTRRAPNDAMRVGPLERGQVTIEFAFALMLLLVCLYAAIASSFWSISRMGTATAAEKAARLATAAQGPGVNANVVNIAAGYTVTSELQTTLIGTAVVQNTSGACRTAAQVDASYGRPTVELCIREVNRPAFNPAAPPPSAQLQAWHVQVQITGCAASLLPLVAGLSSCRGGVVINQIAIIHPQVFQ